MPRYLVHGRLEVGKKAELAARLKDGTLAQGAPYQDRLLSALHSGHGTGDDAYFILDAPDDTIEDMRRGLDGYLDIVDVTPTDNIPGPELATLETYSSLPDWAGVDR